MKNLFIYSCQTLNMKQYIYSKFKKKKMKMKYINS